MGNRIFLWLVQGEAVLGLDAVDEFFDRNLWMVILLLWSRGVPVELGGVVRAASLVAVAAPENQNVDAEFLAERTVAALPRLGFQCAAVAFPHRLGIAGSMQPLVVF